MGVSHSFSGHTKPNGSLHHSDTHTQNTHHSKDTHEDVADTLLPHRMWKTRSTLSPEEEKESEQRGEKRKGIGEKKGMGRGDDRRFFFLSKEDVLNELRKNSDTPTDIKTQAGCQPGPYLRLRKSDLEKRAGTESVHAQILWVHGDMKLHTLGFFFSFFSFFVNVKHNFESA